MRDDAPAVMEVVGITAFEERVYRAVLASPGITLQELVRRSQESSGRVQASLTRLRAKGLVTRLSGRSPRWTATNPGTALRSLARGVLGDLNRLADTADAMEAAFRAIGQDPEGGGQFEVLAGPDELARWYVRLQQEAEEEVLIFDRPPYVLDYRNPLQGDRLREGVRYRTVYAPEAFQHPGALDELERMLSSGEEARVLAGLPFKMVLIDRRQAIMPLHLDPPLNRSVLIRGSTMVVALAELFERLWAEAVPMYPQPASGDVAPDPADQAGEDEGAGPVELGQEDRRLLALLSAGLKDDAIARQLGLSPRSLRRRLRPLMDELKADTRFQAGVEACRRGLV
ncbi:Sugar-specific transcriptional regulator TrmB [Nonomuraea maritima]|uniref:Sugar-specific transcriptional regulator TrmB n=1 Tax=Nonomuraea maritima TaxID=683260 RepID=A0A1G9QLV8_9ACTN|nr:helix-turn-helix domain-containing protein [Nonomuraea maritima]SDM11275.1 Sugar-specific transcriptional regulator TrmB [Nonomuraea maritima]